MSNYEDIKLSIDSGIGSITINRPESGNSVRPQSLMEICHALDTLNETRDVKAIVLKAEGKHFSAGADFSFLDKLTSMPAVDIKSQIYTHFQGAVRRLYNSPKPTVALVSGATLTVGCELTLACDFRLATPSAFFQESWIKLGIMPPLGGVFLLPRLIGLGRATDMVLRGCAIKAEEALEIGLISEIVAIEELVPKGTELANELASTAPLAYATIKQALHRGLETSMELEWAANLSNQAFLLGTEDFKEGLSAAKERRPAQFQGR